MSNRLIALIILIVTIGGFVGAYFYFFVVYSANVSFNGNVEGYKVQFTTENLSSPIDYMCELNPCILEDIAPFDYKISITKEGFDDFVIQQKIQKNGTQTIDFLLTEKINLTELEEIDLTEAELISEKRDRVKYNKYYLNYDFGDDGVFYMQEYLGKLFLYRDRGESEILIYDFPLVSQDKIHIAQIYGSHYYTIYIDGKNYLFHNLDQSFRSIDLKVKVEYGKQGKNNDELIFSTLKGAYVHTLSSKRSEYYSLFHDYIYSDEETVIGIVQENEANMLKNIGLSAGQGNYVVSYSIGSKTYKRLYTTSEEIEQIYMRDKGLILRIGGVDLELKNYKK